MRMDLGSGIRSSNRIGSKFSKSAQTGFNESKSRKKGKSPSPVTLRLTTDELAKLKHMSKGMSRSAYIRKSLFGEDSAPRKMGARVPVKDQQALAQVLGLLGQTRIANNLNQLAYQANTGSLLIDEETLGRINEAHSHVCIMRDELLKALGLMEGSGA